MRLAALFSLAVLLHVEAFAQEGPVIPCPACEQLTQNPWPETGTWYNPSQPGTGFNLEIQNGYLLGYFYGYEENGQPTWNLFSGLLAESETDEVDWELLTQYQHFEHGSCIGCTYEKPLASTGLPVKIEFLQRNYARISVDNFSPQYFVPLIFGSVGYEYIEEIPFVFPEYNDLFLLSIRPPNSEGNPNLWRSLIFMFLGGRVPGGGVFKGSLVYSVHQLLSPVEPSPVGNLHCAWDEPERAVACSLELGSPYAEVFFIPPTNMSDSRFFGEAEDGTIVEGFRISYD